MPASLFKRHPVALSATAVLIVARLFPLSPIVDALTGGAPAGLVLEHPSVYLILQPLSALADLATLSGKRQAIALLAWIVAAYWLWRAARRASLLSMLAGFAGYLGAVVAFLAWTIVLPRPAARLVAVDADVLIVDFHSHTSASRDARRGFSHAANRDWHVKMGFDAAFITDHNTTSAAKAAKEESRRAWAARGVEDRPFRALEGEEISLQDAHIVVLGNRAEIDNKPYDGSAEGVTRFLREAPARFGGVSVLSLPEYVKHHPRDRWRDFARAGAAGLELSNASPKSLDVQWDARADALALAGSSGLFVTAVSDSHGWGSAAPAWSVMRLPGHVAMEPDRLEREVLGALKASPSSAVRVIERTVAAPAAGLPIFLDPPARLWRLLRTFNWLQTLSCLAWLWLAALAGRRFSTGT
ncbi:MAG: hypothetical protein HY078_04395 [Elusimicrobia bacterium]|nr:hypothetical protein [Elusimicrobiota bacterium]